MVSREIVKGKGFAVLVYDPQYSKKNFRVGSNWQKLEGDPGAQVYFPE